MDEGSSGRNPDTAGARPGCHAAPSAAGLSNEGNLGRGHHARRGTGWNVLCADFG